jgi:hypothetical protein
MISGQGSESLTKRHPSVSRQFARAIACISVVLFFPGMAWADGIWDAKKPMPIAANDNSCWIASAANMMAADGWGDAQTIYDALRSDNGGPLDWTKGGVQPTAITAAINFAQNNGTKVPLGSGETGYTYKGITTDPDEHILVDGNQYDKAIDGSKTSTVPGIGKATARAEIDALLNTKTATELPGDLLTEGPDDPVGIGIYQEQAKLNPTVPPDTPDSSDPKAEEAFPFAHAITVWGDSSLGLYVTDSDQSGPAFFLPWADSGNSTTDVLYPTSDPNNPQDVFIGYISFLADTASVPEPTGIIAIVSMCGMGLIGLVWRRVKRA